MDSRYYWLTTLALIPTLGAYTRLSDAGLGCPDWPGCYSKLILPKNEIALTRAQKNFPNNPITPKKAWKEMTHRYFAGLLGILIAVLAVWSFIRHRKIPSQSLLAPSLLVGVIAFQIILGMWTVTMKVMPAVVTIHLMSGMAIAALLCWMSLNAKPRLKTTLQDYSRLTPWAIFGLVIIILQIFLGAWTSINYAALACPSFPFCHSSLFPAFDWKNAFNFITPIGPNYEGEHLAMTARTTIQMTHRYGAFLTVLFSLPFSLYLIINKIYQALRPWGWAILALLAVQCTLGILNVVKLLPLSVAVSHNGVAALFLIATTAFSYKVTHTRRERSL